jgi:nicotinic acid mononucleotide adenylyltransferase/nicotinamide mononucleotide (NMN) deamidase PncC
LKIAVELIHTTPHKAVLAITGGGAEAVGELLRYGGGSNTLLEAVIPYSNKALDEFIGRSPEKYASAACARQMAMAAYRRAAVLSPETERRHLIGLGATSSLAKAGAERAGRKHVAYIAVQTYDSTYTREVELRVPRQRPEEEKEVALFILQDLTGACGLENILVRPHDCDEHRTSLAKGFGVTPAVVHGEHDYISVALNEAASLRPKVVFPGSFNPPHECHLKMAEVAHRLTGHPVDFEIAVTNVDKPPLDYHAITERTTWLEEAARTRPCMGRLYLTNSPRFYDKIKAFDRNGVREITFVVGTDTINRLNDPKYMGGQAAFSAAMAHMDVLGTRFLLFQRKGEEVGDLEMSLKLMTKIVSVDDYLDTGASSSTIRRSECKEES